MAVNRHIAGTAHQGGNFTAGKIPTTTLAFFGAVIRRTDFRPKIPQKNVINFELSWIPRRDRVEFSDR